MHSQSSCQALGVQSKRRGRSYVSKGVYIMMGKFTETADPSSRELRDLGPTVGEASWNKLGLLHLGGSCVAWSVQEAPGSWTRIYSWCMSWPFEDGWNALLSLIQGKGDWSSVNLMYYALLTPQGRTYPFSGVARVWVEGEVGGHKEGRKRGRTVASM